MKPSLTLIRGLPGSGKSTLASRLQKGRNVAVVEADQFFLDEEGIYHYNKAQIGEAHKYCQRETGKNLLLGIDTIVANTFCQFWEIEIYYNMAKEYNLASVQVVTCHGSFPNIHNVPMDKIIQMKENFLWQVQPYAHWLEFKKLERK